MNDLRFLDLNWAYNCSHEVWKDYVGKPLTAQCVAAAQAQVVGMVMTARRLAQYTVEWDAATRRWRKWATDGSADLMIQAALLTALINGNISAVTRPVQMWCATDSPFKRLIRPPFDDSL